MLFKDAEALLEFFNNHEDKVLELFEELVAEEKCKCSDDCKCGDDCECDCDCNKKEEKVTESSESTTISATDIIVESLSANPFFRLALTEDDKSIFYVKDYTATPGTCGNGSIELSDRTSHMNMCENDNVATIELTVMVGGKRISNVPFILSRTTEEPHILLSKKHLL